MSGCPMAGRCSPISISTSPAASSLLVKGPSGSGKTTLLRSLAGLWPHVDGAIARPAGEDSLFLPQQPYLPLGTLRTALAYPTRPVGSTDDEARETLRAVQLGHLIGRLDEDNRGPRRSRPGSSSDWAFGRILLAKPSLVFLDEGNLGLGRGHGARDVRPGPRAAPGVHDRQRRASEHAGALHTDELSLLGEGRWEAKTLVG